MAYQQQGGMGNGALGAPGEQHVPQGTEYTLQGIMRFLQLEWHNHERARNSWDIERAEMKAKIAKQEGESRQAKRLNEQLDRQVKMLELALKNERAKNKAGIKVEADVKSDSPDTPATQNNVQIKKEKTVNDVAHDSPTELEQHGLTEEEREKYMDQTTKYLRNCMKELQYLLTPPAHPPPPQPLPNGNYTGLPEPPLAVEEYYPRQQARPRGSGHPAQQQQQQQHQPQQNEAPPVHNNVPEQNPDMYARRQYSDQERAQTVVEEMQREYPQSSPYSESVENITHTFDARGRAMPETDGSDSAKHNDADRWNFDEEAPSENNPLDVQASRRPDTDAFPNVANNALPAKSPPRTAPSHRRKSSGSQGMSRRRSSQGKNEIHDSNETLTLNDPTQFKVKFALRGHLDVVRSVIFSGGGSPSEPEVCTAGDDGTVKRWMVPASYQNYNSNSTSPDLDVQAYFTHRGHEGVITSLAACPPSTGFNTGGRASGDGWIFSGGQDATVRVWERGRVDPKGTLIGHTDAVWCVCVLPVTAGAVFGTQSNSFGGPDRLLLVSGSADGTVKVWSVDAPPQTSSPSTGSRRGVGGSRRHSVTSGSNFPTSPQPSVATTTPFTYTLIHSIERAQTGVTRASPTCIAPLSASGETFVVSYTDSACLIFDTRTGEELIGMASNETYDGTMNTSINTVVATSTGLEGTSSSHEGARGLEQDEVGAGATGSSEGVEGVVITGHEDRYVRFFDANSGQCTYTMLAHPSAISCLCLSKDGREAVSAGHDASIRFWSLEKRICTQDIVSHRAMRGEGVCCICWSQDGRLVVSAGGDGVVKVFAR
ncbi:hypothetical protein AMS68_004169 [Peltaster fructicola]|uniref:Striatin N-terminal domain-containing protein n=1 Tax=Peltaster fructicola TaxID=286661 RepID=A0A6H0XV64_9PEZI|nr:hypothetical protein AMS68_004169 [Peltaster fructicola]